jgi:hypothetical protein
MLASIVRARVSMLFIGRAVSSAIAPANSISSFSIGCFVLNGLCIIGTKYIMWSFQRALV